MFRESTGFDSIETLSVAIPKDARNLRTIPYQSLFRSLPTAAVLTDLRNQVVICNADFEQLSGYRFREIVGNDLIDILIPTDALEPAKFLFGRLLLGERVRDKQIVKFKDGSVREVEIHGVPIIQKDEQVGIFVLIDDERFAQKKEFSKEFERLKQLAELSQLVGGIGHELRNPLCIIKNSAYLVEKALNGFKNEETSKYLAIIRREAEIANKIILNLLHFIRTRKPQKKWIEPMKPLKQVLIRYPLPENVTLVIDNPNQGFEILVDPDQIEVVLLNLITNAVQAMPSGGKLEIALNSCSRSFTYRITDSGCGIPEDKMDLVFNPFYSSQHNGIGLGLAITKQLVEANQGKISLQSKIGIGTSLFIEFPNQRQI
ncbi:MAG: ATP-binding protein [candidate division WOR-3 bacterium]|nr:ATP-binding protein [candidate division WOR-3 bacterium]MDH5684053.1 ATP-binding protein [candidate division WOR-3 bacterium]